MNIIPTVQLLFIISVVIHAFGDGILAGCYRTGRYHWPEAQLHHAAYRPIRNEVDLTWTKRCGKKVTEPLFEEGRRRRRRSSPWPPLPVLPGEGAQQAPEVRLPSGTTTEASTITEIPKISDPNIEEVEVTPIEEPYSFVRIQVRHRGRGVPL